MYEMEGPQFDPVHDRADQVDTVCVARPTTYLEDLVACSGCPELAIGARFAPVTRPDPNPAT